MSDTEQRGLTLSLPLRTGGERLDYETFACWVLSGSVQATALELGVSVRTVSRRVGRVRARLVRERSHREGEE